MPSTEKRIGTVIAMLASFLTPVLLELLLHLFIYGQMSGRIIFPILFALTAGGLLYGLCCLIPKKAAPIVLCVLLGLITFYFEVQLVYNSIFGEFMSLMQLFTGAAAVTNFFKQMLYGIWQVLPQILAMLLPLAAVITLTCLKKLTFQPFRWYRPAGMLLICVVLHFSTIGVMAESGAGAYSVFGLYNSRSTGTEISVNNIGLLTTTRLEFKYMLEPQQQVQQPAPDYAVQGQEQLDEALEYNVLDIDFPALEATRDQDAMKKLDEYFSSISPTEKHQYTGMLKDYNLITICAESFSSLLIDPVRTPTLYRLSTGGFVFRNYYGTYGSNTTNGEYTFCMGNYPDMSRSKAAASFYASQFNSLPFCLGNELKARGYQTWAYHNYSGEYYSRRDTHPNMGYVFQAAGSGLDIEINWPSSDLEMMEASMDDYLSSDQPFHAYYMTFSGHYQYDWENPMSLKNKALTDDLPYSETVKAYIACNMELEKALTYMLQRLEEAGVADKTVIVLTNDHYPYGLTDEQYNELAGREIDTTFEKYHNSFICYVPDMDPVIVDDYCSTADALPTILNLFGLPYDSRLLAGRDILSQGAYDMAVLSDQSFVTADYGFDAATGQVRVFSEGYHVDEADLARRQSLIRNEFQASLDVLNYDYYRSTVPALTEDAEGSPAESPAQLPETDPVPTAPEPLPYTDIPEGKSTDCLRYLIGNGYLEPASETKFGYSATATYAEFLDVLYRMDGSPNFDNTWVYLGSDKPITGKYLSAAKWAAYNKLLNIYPENLDSYRSLTRNHAAVTLMRYAQKLGYSTAVDDEALLAQMTAQHREFTAEECRALTWCYNHLIINGSGGKLLHVMDDNPNLNRYDMARVIYNFWLYVLQNDAQ